MPKTYDYVGPRAIREQARDAPLGTPISNEADLRAWVQARVAAGTPLDATFTLDDTAVLRVADRHSEHVACSGARPVLAAGEMVFRVRRDRVEVIELTNQSTGYWPEPSTWPVVDARLNDLQIVHPERWSAEFTFRRCPACGQTNIVKDDVYECAMCDSALPVEWNYV